MKGVPLVWPIGCFLIGVLGAFLGAWVCTARSRAQLEALRLALELDREKAGHDLQRALLCVPQWVQQAVRLEFERLGRQQAERSDEQAREQRRWQAAQDELRRHEWQTLRGAAAGRAPATLAPAALAPSAPRPPRPSPPQSEPPKAPPPRAAAAQAPEHPLSDEEIDALPPDLPPPAPPPGRKLLAPKGPVMRNI